MRSISFILALISLLFAVQFSVLCANVVKEYEKLMNSDYNIIIVSTKELTEPELRPLVPTLSSLLPLSAKKIVDRLNNDISSKNLSILQNALPKFYTLKLNALPSTGYMKQIRQKLLNIDGVSKVETFLRTHDKVYKTLNLLKFISYIFIGIVGFTGLLLMSRQIRIWSFEHRDRIEIMSLFGASFWQKSAVLYRYAIFSSIVATLVVTAIFYFLPDFISSKELISQISIAVPKISLIDEAPTLLGVSLFISIFMVSIVTKRVS